MSEKFRVRVGHGLFRKLVCYTVFGDTFKEDETIGKSAPFLYFTMKKILTVLISCFLCICSIHAEVTWKLDGRTLTISGSGDMDNYSYRQSPWYPKCKEIYNIVIEQGVTSIGDLSFQDCINVTSVIIPNGVISIGNYAFLDCQYLKSVIIPNSVVSIGNSAFYNCSLTSVTIPNSVTSIGQNAFWDCHLNSITIPNSMTSIGDHTFNGCRIKTIIIPNSVTSIGNYAFFECKYLATIDIPNSVTSIGKGAFAECKNLTSITLPNSITSISDGTFNSCTRLKTIVIPESVTSIGKDVFLFCENIASLTCEACVPPSCDIKSFSDVNKSIAVYVPANSVDAYKNADGWKNFTNIQAIPGKYIITDGNLYTNNSQINEQDISYARTFNNTNWQALYIPFSLSYDDWKDDFEIACINGVRQLDKDDNGTIDETIMDVIKIKSGSTTPNMPYLIKAKTTGEKTFSVNNATLYAAEENSLDCSTTIAKYTFTGTYSSIPSETMIANNYYAMGGGDLIQSDGSNDLKPYRWYMKVESRNPSYNVSNAAKTITINVIGDEEEETTTGVKELRITNDELPVYDLNGRKVNENSLKPGLYIKNGKKFVVK